MKTEMFVESVSPYFGKRVYRIARLTKRQLVTEPVNETGARIRFYRPATAGLVDGMPLTLFPKKGYVSSIYTLRINNGDCLCSK